MSREIVRGGGDRIIIRDLSTPKPDDRNILIRKEYERIERGRLQELKRRIHATKKSKQHKERHKEPPNLPSRPSHSRPTPHEKRKSNNKHFFFIAVSIVLIMLGVFSIFQYSSPKTHDVTEEQVKTIQVTKPVIVATPVQISFSEYINNYETYDKQNVTLTGSLQREIEGTEQSGVYVEYMADDKGNKIEMLSLTKEHKKLFPRTGKADGVYEIKGIFKRKHNELELQVTSITAAEREMVDVEKTITVDESVIVYVNQTVNKTNFIGKLLNAVDNILNPPPTLCEDGTPNAQCSANPPFYCKNEQLTKNPSFCGCPVGQRLYSNECISIIKCEDGTLHPECSATKKMQCVNGTYTMNADKCGCPDDFVKRQNTCVPTCEDGTAYAECSKNKPFYCQNGNLIIRASQCGCRSQYYPKDDECVEKTKAIESAIFKYTNTERKNNGLPELKWNDKLFDIARAHSQDMADNNFFSHDNLRGEDPSARAARMGFTQIKQLGGGWYTEGIAENIGQMTAGDIVGIGYVYDTPDSIGQAQVESWMQSPGHRANILEKQYSDIGIGVAYDGYDYTATQNFW